MSASLIFALADGSQEIVWPDSPRYRELIADGLTPVGSVPESDGISTKLKAFLQTLVDALGSDAAAARDSAQDARDDAEAAAGDAGVSAGAAAASMAAATTSAGEAAASAESAADAVAGIGNANFANKSTEAAAAAAPMFRPPEKHVYYGFDDATGWTFSDISGTATTGNWSYAGGVLTRNTTGTADDLGLRSEVMGDGRVSVLLQSNRTVATQFYAGVVARANGTDRLVGLLRDGVSGGNRQLSLWRINGGSYTQLGSWVNVGGVGFFDPTSPDPAYLEVGVEIVGDQATMLYNGVRVAATTQTIPATLTRPGKVGIFVKPHTTLTRGFQAMSVTQYDYKAVPADAGSSIVCIGSSITNQYNITTAGAGWRDKLAASLTARAAGVTVNVINAGSNGDTTGPTTPAGPTGMLARLSAGIAGWAPRVVIIETSINDLKTTSGITPAQTQANLRTMVQIVKRNGAVPVLWTSMPFAPGLVNSGGFDATCYAAQHVANALSRQLAIEERVLLADCFRASNADYVTNLQGDHIHPNDAGDALIYQTLWNVIRGAQRL